MSIKIRSLKVLEGIERDAGIKAGATKEDDLLIVRNDGNICTAELIVGDTASYLMREKEYEIDISKVYSDIVYSNKVNGDDFLQLNRNNITLGFSGVYIDIFKDRIELNDGDGNKLKFNIYFKKVDDMIEQEKVDKREGIA